MSDWRSCTSPLTLAWDCVVATTNRGTLKPVAALVVRAARSNALSGSFSTRYFAARTVSAAVQPRVRGFTWAPERSRRPAVGPTGRNANAQLQNEPPPLVSSLVTHADLDGGAAAHDLAGAAQSAVP